MPAAPSRNGRLRWTTAVALLSSVLVAALGCYEVRLDQGETVAWRLNRVTGEVCRFERQPTVDFIYNPETGEFEEPNGVGADDPLAVVCAGFGGSPWFSTASDATRAVSRGEGAP